MKLSHHQHILPVLFLLAGIAVLWGCSPLELPDSAMDGGIVSATQSFSVSVSDGGYSPTDPSPHTRATENGYTTTFTAGDKIGVFAVKDGAIVDGVNNLCLIATTATGGGSGSTLVWQDANGKAPLNISGATYYAYYPYQETLSGSLSPSGASAPDAATFFADVISQWTPSTAQGTYADYTAQDLMIAQGSVSGKSLSFPMQHQMSLAVIDLPKTKYTLTSDPSYTWISDAPDTKFNGFVPCRMSDGTYRYLVKPTTDGLLSGSYTNSTSDISTTTIEWNFTATIGASNYKTYKVDGGSTTTIDKSHTLTAGDFYMKDGSLLAGTTASLTDAQKAACIGIVYWVGDITGDNYSLLNDKFPTGTHGLVVSLWNAKEPDDGSEEKMTWTYGSYESVQDQLASAWTDKPIDYNIQEEKKMQGYVNTIALQKYNEYVVGNTAGKNDYGLNSQKRIKPIYALANFKKAHPAPDKSSGWYWPSACELQYVCWGQGNSSGVKGKDMLNPQIEKAGGTVFGRDYYWSSTEYSDYSNRAWYVDFGNGVVGNYGSKYGRICRVRPLLAF